MTVHIHPSVDNGVKNGSGNFAGGTLVCKCKDKPVKVGVKGDVAHNHACGCTKCWKPAGTDFSIVAVAARDKRVALPGEDQRARDRGPHRARARTKSRRVETIRGAFQ